VKDRLLAVAVATGVVGAGLMLAFDGLVARIVGVLALGAFIVCGLFAVADPRFLADDEPGGAERDGPTPPPG
jgi:hypothetical protein